MKMHTIEIIETLSRVVKIKADSIDEAIAIAEKKYQNSKIVLDADDFCKYEIFPYPDNDEK